MGLGDLELSDTSFDPFASAPKGVVEAGVGAGLPSPSPEAPEERLVHLSPLHLSLYCGVAGDWDLLPI